LLDRLKSVSSAHLILSHVVPDDASRLSTNIILPLPSASDGGALWFNSSFVDPDEQKRAFNGSSWHLEARQAPYVAAVGISRSVGVVRLLLSDSCGDIQEGQGNRQLPRVILRGDCGAEGGLAFGAVRVEVVHALARDVPVNSSVRAMCSQGGLPVRVALYAAVFSMAAGADAHDEVQRFAELVSAMPVSANGSLSDHDWSVRVQGIAVPLAAARKVRSNPLEAVAAGVLYRRVNDRDVPPITHLNVNGEAMFQLPNPPGSNN
jgi:hypothetical protein